MRGTIGYYVHHQGDGHRQRALAIARQAPDRFSLIGTGLAGRVDEIPYLDLPDDRLSDGDGFDGVDNAANRPLALHYAPLNHDGIRRRAALFAEWIARTRPALMVVDVSVEIAMLARLTSTPAVYVRLAGHRHDPAHLEAFRSARALLSPFHARLDDPETVNWVKAKTYYLPGLCISPPSVRPNSNRVLVVFGKGGFAGNRDFLTTTARCTPSLEWRIIGPVSMPGDKPENLEILGWVENAEEEIAAAGVVVGAAGDGLVNAVIAAKKPFICIPERRPFDEQLCKAYRLETLGGAIVLGNWPSPDRWDEILQKARALDPEVLAALHDDKGLAKAAELLLTLSESKAPRTKCIAAKFLA